MRFAACLLLLGWSCLAIGQKVTVTAERVPGANLYQLQVDGVRYVAVTEEAFRAGNQRTRELDEEAKKWRAMAEEFKQAAEENQKLRAQNQALAQKQETLINDNLSLGRRYSEKADELLTLSKDYVSLNDKLFDLTNDYRNVALRSRPREAIDLGVGVINTESKNRVVAMAGFGMRLTGFGLRGWVFGGEDTYGLMAGISF